MLDLITLLWWLGVCHADELFQMFANNLLPGPISADDKKVSQMLIDLWTSFAIEGYRPRTAFSWISNFIVWIEHRLDRTPRSDLTAEWLPMDENETRYLNIDAKNPVMMMSEDLPFRSRLPYWDQILGPIQAEEENGVKKDELWFEISQINKFNLCQCIYCCVELCRSVR